MNTTTEDNRRPEEIERDIERTRAEVSSTIDAIQEKLTPGEMMDQALQYIRGSGGGDFGRALGRAVRDNPMPVALIGVGLAWLAMGSRARSDTSPWSDDAYDDGGYASGLSRSRRSALTSSDYGSVAGDRSDYAGGMPRDYADDDLEANQGGPGIKDKVAGAAASVKDTVTGAAASVKDTVASATSRVREGVSSATGRARSMASDTGQRAGMLRARTRARADRTYSSAMRMVDDQPLVLGAVGLAVGAALGAALPSTRREDQLMGEVRDNLLEGASDTARESMRSVPSVAQRVVRSAREEVEKVLDSATSGEAQPSTKPSTKPSDTSLSNPGLPSSNPGISPASGTGGSTSPGSGITGR